MTQLNRELLYQLAGEGAIPRLEEKFRRSIGVKQRVPFRNIPFSAIKTMVGTDDSLVSAKVIDSVIAGAEDDEGLWQLMAKIVYMEKAKEMVPFITADDFAPVPWVQGTAPRASGGSFWAAELDCSLDKGLYAFRVGLTKNWIRDNGFDKLEESLRAAGQAMGRQLIQATITKYLADVDATMTNTLANWGNAHYHNLVKMESLIADVGMSPTIALVNPDEGYDVGVSDYFISQDYERAARGIPRDLHAVGNLYGRIPIIRHRDVTAASMIMAAAEKAMVIGLMDEGIKIEDFDDVQQGMEGAVVSLQYCIKSGKDAAGPKDATKPTAKSWAVTTSA